MDTPTPALTSARWPEGAALLGTIHGLLLEAAAMAQVKRRTFVGEVSVQVCQAHPPSRPSALAVDAKASWQYGAQGDKPQTGHARLAFESVHASLMAALDAFVREGAALAGLRAHGLFPVLDAKLGSPYRHPMDPDGAPLRPASVRGYLGLFDAGVEAPVGTDGVDPSGVTARPEGARSFLRESDPMAFPFDVDGPTFFLDAAQRFLDTVDLLCIHAPAPDAPVWLCWQVPAASEPGEGARGRRVSSPHHAVFLQAEDAEGAAAIGQVFLRPSAPHGRLLVLRDESPERVGPATVAPTLLPKSLA